MSSITYLKLDAQNDPIFDPQASLVDIYAVQQAIKTRILLFQGEWWENLNEGTPMFQSIMGRRATPSGQQVMSSAFSARVSGTPYVAAVQDPELTFDVITRALAYESTALTSFGPIPVVIAPGATAVIT